MGPFGERFGLGSSGEESTDEFLDVVVEPVDGDLQPADGAAEPGFVAVFRCESAADVDLEAGDLFAVVGGDDLAFEADVGGLDAGAGVRAAVEVEADRVGQLVDVGEALLEARDGVDGGLLGFDDREFAEFDAGAGHHGAAEEVLAAGQADLVELGDDVVDFVFGDVEQEDLLVRGEPDPVGAELLGDITDLVEQRTRGATGDKARADVIPAVLLLVDAHMVAGDGRLLRCRSVGELVPEVFGFEDLAELLRAPVGEEEFHARLVPQAAVAVVTEDLGDAEPDVDGLVRGDPRAEAFGEARDDGQCTAHPQVVADSVFGMFDGDH